MLQSLKRALPGQGPGRTLLAVDDRRTSPARSRRAVVGAVAAGTVLSLLPLAPAALVPDASAAALQIIPFEAVNNGHVVLGDLASRSQGNYLSIAGIGPYTVTGTDAASGQPYTFETDKNYSGSANVAYKREGDEKTLTSAFGGSSNTNASYLGRSNVMQMRSSTNCTGPAYQAPFCSIFGPDVYSQPFNATAGQAVSFDWAADDDDDDYEIYAFLVKVNETSPGVYDRGTASSHTLLTYGRGKNQGWTTASGSIDTTGTYRFRFVNGSFDGTGGLLVGSIMYIDNVVKVGMANPITFGSLSDKIAGASAFAVTATAPGGVVTFTSSTPTRCTVSGSTVSLVGPTGICTIVANQPGDGIDYVPAPSVARSFTILAAATAPTNSGAPMISGSLTPGSVLTFSEGTWADGGSPITGSSSEWRTTTGGVTTVVSGAVDQCVVVASPGSTISVAVTKTNSVGSTTVASAATISGYSCVAPTAPSWTDATLGGMKEGEPYTDGVQVASSPPAVYAVASGSLPDGLSLNTATGAITGTPTAAGPYSFVISAWNSVFPVTTMSFSGTVAPADVAPVWVDEVLGDLQEGVAFSGGVEASGHPAPAYSVTDGVLPAGLTLDAVTGSVTGTPTSAGPYSFTITASNGVDPQVTKVFSGTVAPPDSAPVWVDEVLGDLQEGVAFSGGVEASGHPAPAYSVTDGVLPAGLSLDAVTGSVTGTPTSAGPYSFTITASNGIDPEISKDFTGTVAPPDSAPLWTDSTLSLAQVGVAFSDGVEASGHPAPAYSVTAGSLPAGLSLDAVTGSVTGTPTSAGPYSFTITASNGIDPEITKDFTGTVARSADSYSGGGLTLVVGTPLDLAVEVDDIDSVTSYSVTAGSLPAGLTLDPSTGAIVGTPIGAGPYNFTITATSSDGSVSRTFSGSIAPQDRGYLGLVPGRLFDSREVGGKLAAGTIQEVVVRGRFGVPADATSVTLTVAADAPDADGFITVFPCGAEVAWAANLNYVAGLTATNAVTAAVGADGKVCFYTLSATHLVVDVNGAFSPSEGVGYLQPTTPGRLFDSREVGGKLAAGTVHELVVVGGDHGVPLDATAVVLNITATQAEEDGYVTAYPCGGDVPWAASLHYAAGRTTLNSVTAAVGKGGAVCLFTMSTAHIVVDVNASYAPDARATLKGINPERLLDTRIAGEKVAAGTIHELVVAGAGTVPSGATAVVLNVTAADAETDGFITAFPCGIGAVPWAANLHFGAGEIIPNSVTVAVGEGGKVCFYTLATTHLVVDVDAYQTL